MSKESFRQKGLFSDLNVEKREKEREENWQRHKNIIRGLLETVNQEVYNGEWSFGKTCSYSRNRIGK